MAVRRAYILEDVRECIYRTIKKLTDNTAPWTSWVTERGWPETDLVEQYEKPIIYIDAPLIPNAKKQQQGGLPALPVSIIIGVWNDQSTGGLEENNIMASHIAEKFLNPADLNSITFNVTLGSTTYSGTTLYNQGVLVKNVYGPRDVSNPDMKEFRREMEIEIETN